MGKQVCCVICGKELKLLQRLFIADNLIACYDCIQKAFSTEYKPKAMAGPEEKRAVSAAISLSADKIKQQIAAVQAVKDADTFSTTITVGTFLLVDEAGQQFRLSNGITIPFDNLVDFELIDEGKTVMQGGFSSAALGAMLFGSVGAIVGSNIGQKGKEFCNSMSIKLILNDISNPSEYINIIEQPLKRESGIYKKLSMAAQECLSLLQVICERNKKAQPPIEQSQSGSENSSADELRKFKALLDDGIITQEDFDTKKKQLLGI